MNFTQMIAPQPVADTTRPMARPVSISCCTPTATCRGHGRSARCMQHGTQQHAHAQRILAQAGCWRPARPGRAGQGACIPRYKTIISPERRPALPPEQDRCRRPQHQPQRQRRPPPRHQRRRRQSQCPAWPPAQQRGRRGQARSGSAGGLPAELGRALAATGSRAAAALATGGMQRKASTVSAAAAAAAAAALALATRLCSPVYCILHQLRRR